MGRHDCLSYGLSVAGSDRPILVRSDSLLLLMTVLSQSFFALVRGHLVAFSFLSAWHNENIYIVTVYCLSGNTVSAAVSPDYH